MPARIMTTGITGRRAPYVIVVDADEDALALCVDLFEANGMAAVGVKTLSLARELIAIDRPAAIVVDLAVPDEAVAAWFADLRRQAPTVRLPIIALSVDLEMRHLALNAGATVFQPKPYNPRRLVAHVAALVFAERDYDRRRIDRGD